MQVPFCLSSNPAANAEIGGRAKDRTILRENEAFVGHPYSAHVALWSGEEGRGGGGGALSEIQLVFSRTRSEVQIREREREREREQG